MGQDAIVQLLGGEHRAESRGFVVLYAFICVGALVLWLLGHATKSFYSKQMYAHQTTIAHERLRPEHLAALGESRSNLVWLQIAKLIQAGYLRVDKHGLEASQDWPQGLDSASYEILFAVRSGRQIEETAMPHVQQLRRSILAEAKEKGLLVPSGKGLPGAFGALKLVHGLLDFGLWLAFLAWLLGFSFYVQELILGKPDEDYYVWVIVFLVGCFIFFKPWSFARKPGGRVFARNEDGVWVTPKGKALSQSHLPATSRLWQVARDGKWAFDRSGWMVLDPVVVPFDGGIANRPT
ncbi:hypothetical protein QVA66_05575 [Staphylococcus chromogenes]|nr:hypothetical protein [Staphylococcus chromogenes]